MTQPIPHDVNGLVRYRDVRELGRAAELTTHQESGRLRRVSRGVYSIKPLPIGPRAVEGAYRERVLAAALGMKHPVFTSLSAAVLYGLPLIGRQPEGIYVMSAGPHGKRRRGVISVARRAEVGARCISGVAATPVEFSLIQLARHASLRQALVATDAALLVPQAGERGPLTTPELLTDEWHRLVPFHGSARVRAVFSRMSTLAETPLETLSRVVIEELGFATPQLQQRFWLPGLGKAAFTDFYWHDVAIVGEADGHGKYRHANDGADPAEVVIAEKEREDELRLQVRGVVRWGWADVWRPHRLESILLRAGVPRVRGPRRL